MGVSALLITNGVLRARNAYCHVHFHTHTYTPPCWAYVYALLITNGLPRSPSRTRPPCWVYALLITNGTTNNFHAYTPPLLGIYALLITNGIYARTRAIHHHHVHFHAHTLPCWVYALLITNEWLHHVHVHAHTYTPPCWAYVYALLITNGATFTSTHTPSLAGYMHY